MAAQFSGQTWEYRDDSRAVGELTPVSHTDATGRVWTGWAEVAGFDEYPDAEYHNGIRREMRVRGAVVNQARTVVIDDAPQFQRVPHHYQ